MEVTENMSLVDANWGTPLGPCILPVAGTRT